MVVIQTMLSFPLMTSLLTTQPFIGNETKSHLVVPPFDRAAFRAGFKVRKTSLYVVSSSQTPSVLTSYECSPVQHVSKSKFEQEKQSKAARVMVTASSLLTFSREQRSNSLACLSTCIQAWLHFFIGKCLSLHKP